VVEFRSIADAKLDYKIESRLLKDAFEDKVGNPDWAKKEQAVPREDSSDGR